MQRDREPDEPEVDPDPGREKETHDPPYEIDPPAPPKPARPDGVPPEQPKPQSPPPDHQSSDSDPDSHEVERVKGTLLGPFFDDIVGSQEEREAS